MSNKITLPIKGLHCRSCEVLVQEKLSNVAGVRHSKVSFKRASAEIHTEGDVPAELIEAAIKEAGYAVGYEHLPWFSRASKDWLTLFIIAAAVILAVAAFRFFGLKLELFRFGQPENLITVALIGLAAGFSTCMAMSGGLLMALSAKYSQKHPEADSYSKLLPQLMFNSGRLISYAVLGGAIGLIGSAFQISPLFWAVLTAVAALVMLFLGLQLVNVFPRLSKWSISLPNFKLIAGAKSETYSHVGALILGGLTFFLPCGFTQAMQLYAVSTGSFFAGLMVMLTFAIGTLPGLLVAGLIGSMARGKWAKLFLTFIGVVVIMFAAYNLMNASNLLGLGNLSWGGQSDTANACPAGAVKSASGLCPINSVATQVIKADFTLADDIKPSEFKVTAGAPVRFEVNALDNGSGCMSTIMIPGLYNKPIFLAKGQTIVMEFTPTRAGSYPITCAMGIKRGTLIVQ